MRLSPPAFCKVTKVLFGVIIYYRAIDVNSKETKVQIRKTYQNVNPELLYDEIRDLVVNVTGEYVIICDACYAGVSRER